MKLTKKGTKLEVIWKATCSKCGSEFEATQKELEPKIKNDQRDGSWAEDKCTECNYVITFYPSTSLYGQRD